MRPVDHGYQLTMARCYRNLTRPRTRYAQGPAFYFGQCRRHVGQVTESAARFNSGDAGLDYQTAELGNVEATHWKTAEDANSAREVIQEHGNCLLLECWLALSHA